MSKEKEISRDIYIRSEKCFWEYFVDEAKQSESGNVWAEGEGRIEKGELIKVAWKLFLLVSGLSRLEFGANCSSSPIY